LVQPVDMSQAERVHERHQSISRAGELEFRGRPEALRSSLLFGCLADREAYDAAQRDREMRQAFVVGVATGATAWRRPANAKIESRSLAGMLWLEYYTSARVSTDAGGYRAPSCFPHSINRLRDFGRWRSRRRRK
jgi:hypothetical protein